MVIGIIILLIEINTGILSAEDIDVTHISPIIFDGDMLYVGGTGPNNYSKIQDAIDDAVDGDTIFVYSGTYHEHELIVDKSINLVGENTESTIIDGDEVYYSNVLYLSKDNILIKNFTIQYAGHQGNGVEIRSNYNEISDCIFQYNHNDGIFVGDNCNYNIISNCSFSDNRWGVYMKGWDGYPSNNIVTHCYFDKLNNVVIYQGNNNVISQCVFSESGIIFDGECNGNVISSCQISNTLNGIHIGAYGSDNRIENCVIKNAESYGIRVDRDQLRFQVYNCTIENSGTSNILFWCIVIDCVITDCKLTNATYNGVHFVGRIRQVEVSGCHFEGNDAGIELTGSTFFNKFNKNNFINQRRHLLLYMRIIDRMFNFYDGNYWDDWRGIGPYHIFGLLNWDFNPAQEPYDILGGRV